MPQRSRTAALNHRYFLIAAERFAPRPAVLSGNPLMATPSSYRSVEPNTNRASGGRATRRGDAPGRPEIERALERLQNMPPFARERELETGRYRQFSAEDKQILRNGE